MNNGFMPKTVTDTCCLLCLKIPFKKIFKEMQIKNAKIYFCHYTLGLETYVTIP